jgi:hypothetical protein
MRRRIHRIGRLAAIVLVAGAATAPAAVADGKVYSERAGEPDLPAECAAWSSAMARSLALYGITGAQAAEYLDFRLDNPCHRRLTPRSVFHAGDPGRA